MELSRRHDTTSSSTERSTSLASSTSADSSSAFRRLRTTARVVAHKTAQKESPGPSPTLGVQIKAADIAAMSESSAMSVNQDGETSITLQPAEATSSRVTSETLTKPSSTSSGEGSSTTDAVTTTSTSRSASTSTSTSEESAPTTTSPESSTITSKAPVSSAVVVPIAQSTTSATSTIPEVRSSTVAAPPSLTYSQPSSSETDAVASATSQTSTASPTEASLSVSGMSSPSAISASSDVPPSIVHAATTTNTFGNAIRPAATYHPPLPTDQTAGDSAGHSENSNKGKEAGAIIGSLAALLLLIAALLFALRWWKRRRQQTDRAALMRSSWFYGGDVGMHENEKAENDQDGFISPQSRFSSSTIGHTSARFSSFRHSIANFSPLRNLRDSSSRFPRLSTYADPHSGSPGARAGYDPQTDVPRPIPAPAGIGGWAERFFALTPASDAVLARGENVAETTATQPSISHPFTAGSQAEYGWGQTHLPAIGSPLAPFSPPRDLLLCNPDRPSLSYQDTVAMSTVPPGALTFPQPQMSITTVAENNESPSTRYLVPTLHAGGDSHVSSLFEFDPYSHRGSTRTGRGLSMATSHSAYSTDSAYPELGQTVVPLPKPSHLSGVSGVWANMESYEGRDAGVGPRKSVNTVKWSDGVVGDGTPRAL